MTKSFHKIFQDLPNNNDIFIESPRKSYSFKEFKHRVEIKIDQLKNANKHDFVCIETGKDIDYFVDLVATLVKGCVAVPIAAELSKLNRDYIIRQTKPKLLIQKNNEIVTFDRQTIQNSYSVVLFTSGTTGDPKGVALTEQAILGNAYSTLKRLNLEYSDTLFTNIPFQFTSMLSHFLACIVKGSHLYLEEKFLLQNDFIKAIIKSNANCFGGSPTQLLWISQSEHNLHSEFKWLMSSGDHLPTSTILNIIERYTYIDIYVFYGITEVGGRFCSLAPKDLTNKLGSVGKPIDGLSLKILDENSNRLAHDEVGEIFATGDYLLKEYLNNSEATSKAITTNGYKTGDMGYVDKDGYLYHVGRNDDVFKFGGQKVSGLAIKDEILKIPEIKDAIVIPFDEEIIGTIPVACIVIHNHKKIKKGLLLRKLRQILPANHIPKSWYQFEVIPRTGSGKALKKEILRRIKSKEDVSEL